MWNQTCTVAIDSYSSGGQWWTVDSGQWWDVAVFGLANGRLDCSFKPPSIVLYAREVQKEGRSSKGERSDLVEWNGRAARLRWESTGKFIAFVCRWDWRHRVGISPNSLFQTGWCSGSMASSWWSIQSERWIVLRSTFCGSSRRLHLSYLHRRRVKIGTALSQHLGTLGREPPKLTINGPLFSWCRCGERGQPKNTPCRAMSLALTLTNTMHPSSLQTHPHRLELARLHQP